MVLSLLPFGVVTQVCTQHHFLIRSNAQFRIYSSMEGDFNLAREFYLLS